MTAREKYNLTPFAGNNFSAWEFRIKSILRDNGVLEAVTNKNYGNIEENETGEAKAQAILIGGIADTHLEYVKNMESAYDMFSNLEYIFKQKGVRSRLFMRRSLNEIKFNDKESLQSHFIKLEELFTLLQDSGSEVSEEEKINYILMSMSKSYEAVVTAIETQPSLEMGFVKNRLLGEEEKRTRPTAETSSSLNYAFSCFICGKRGHKKIPM